MENKKWKILQRQKREAYYRSEAWQLVRKAVWKRAKGQCERCQGKGIRRSGRDCHHLSYKVLYHELEGDNLQWVQLVCPDCHAYYHPEHNPSYSVQELVREWEECQNILRQKRKVD